MFSFTATSQQVTERDATSQVGFKIVFCETTRRLRVKVIGARQLPTFYGSIKPIGYVIKVRVPFMYFLDLVMPKFVKSR